MGLEHKPALVSNCEGQGVETQGSKGASLVIFTWNQSLFLFLVIFNCGD